MQTVGMRLTILKQLKLDFYKKREFTKKLALDMVLSEIETIENRQNKSLTDVEIDAIIKRCVAIFDEMTELGIKVNRDVTVSSAQADYLRSLLPVQLSVSETANAVASAIKITNAASISDMGKVMAHLKVTHKSSLDYKLASCEVKSQLTK